MLLQRALSVIAALPKLTNVARHVRGSHVIMARNLEMLALATQAQRRYAPAAKLVYECLDIHRLLLSGRLEAALLRLLEFRLWEGVDLLLTSSPAFVRNYFAPRDFAGPIRLVENKLLLLEDDDLCMPPTKRPAGPPWRIGWFGMIRCRKSLDILNSLALAAQGSVEVIIRGRPSGAVFPDFDAALASRPHVRYAGPYNPSELPSIYGDVHFTWAVDYYESGQNSAWLLPNRIYEGTFYGAVPIGLAEVETGAWLRQRAVGVVLNEPLEEQLSGFLRSLDQHIYAKLAGAVNALPRSDLVNGRTDCRDLVEALRWPVIGHRHDDIVESVGVGQRPNSLGARQ